MNRTRWLLVLGVAVVAALALRPRRSLVNGFDPVAAAKARWEEVRGEGVDLSVGPCLGVIAPDWVADVAHDPRQPVDDDPANQCTEYRTGTARHFVELTPDGTLIRAK